MKRKKRKSTDPIIYSDEFKTAVLSVFSSSERIKRMLEENAFSLGYSLSEGGITSIDPVLVVSLLDAGQQDKLLRVARDAVEKKRLYELWKKEVYK